MRPEFACSRKHRQARPISRPAARRGIRQANGTRRVTPQRSPSGSHLRPTSGPVRPDSDQLRGHSLATSTAGHRRAAQLAVADVGVVEVAGAGGRPGAGWGPHGPASAIASSRRPASSDRCGGPSCRACPARRVSAEQWVSARCLFGRVRCLADPRTRPDSR